MTNHKAKSHMIFDNTLA